MISIDTNILLYGIHPGIPEHKIAKDFLDSMGRNQEVVITELVLAELYQLIRNPKVFGRAVSAEEAVGVIHTFRRNPNWLIAENAPVMEKVWQIAGEKNFARRRLFDVRLAYTLQHHGVTHFATANVKDFQDLGFEKVWNPLVEEM